MSAATVDQKDLSFTPVLHKSAPVSLVWPSFLVGVLALAGSLWLSVGMGLKACPLCFYQRTFVMGPVTVLGIGVLTGQRHRAVLNLLALPLAVGGFGVAAFHVFLELSGKLECPAGILGIGTAPAQSLAVLSVLLLLVVVGVVRSGKTGEPHPSATVAAVVLGPLLAWGAVASAPPMPPAPAKAYTNTLDTCRPPFRGQ